MIEGRRLLSGSQRYPPVLGLPTHASNCNRTRVCPCCEPGCLLPQGTEIKHVALVLESSSFFSSTFRLPQISLILIILCNCVWAAVIKPFSGSLPPHRGAAPHPCLYRCRTKQDSAKCLKCHGLLFSYFYTDLNALQDVTRLLPHPDLWKLQFKKRGRKSCLTLPLNVSQP